MGCPHDAENTLHDSSFKTLAVCTLNSATARLAIASVQRVSLTIEDIAKAPVLKRERGLLKKLGFSGAW